MVREIERDSEEARSIARTLMLRHNGGHPEDDGSWYEALPTRAVIVKEAAPVIWQGDDDEHVKELKRERTARQRQLRQSLKFVFPRWSEAKVGSRLVCVADRHAWNGSGRDRTRTRARGRDE